MSYKADEMFLEADQLIAASKIAEARTLLYKIIEEYPDYGRAHNHLGWLNEHKLRRFDRADEHYKAALKFSPEYPAAWVNYIFFLSEMQRFDELTEHLTKASEIKGVAKNLIYNEFGSMAETKGEYEKAREYYTKAIQAAQNDDNIELYEKSIARIDKKNKLTPSTTKTKKFWDK